MDPILKQKITDKLTAFLNREPTENEIINGQTDAHLMQWISQDDALIQIASNESLKAEIAALKASSKSMVK